jgi:hypothetical protein
MLTGIHRQAPVWSPGLCGLSVWPDLAGSIVAVFRTSLSLTTGNGGLYAQPVDVLAATRQNAWLASTDVNSRLMIPFR